MSTKNASCSCGQIKLAARGEPIGVTLCHCLECQARTGSTYSVQASYSKANVSHEGKATEFVRIGDEGSRAQFYFCPTCGSTVWYRINDEEVVVVPIGAFALEKAEGRGNAAVKRTLDRLGKTLLSGKRL